MAKVTAAGMGVYAPEHLPYSCQKLRNLLLDRAAGSGVGYDPEKDDRYRSIRGAVLQSMRGQRWLRSLVKSAELVYPDSLAELPDNLSWSDWRTMTDLGDDAVVRFQGNLLSAVLAAGVKPSWNIFDASRRSLHGEGIAPTERSTPTDPPSANGVTTAPALRRDQQRAAKRKLETWRLRDEGLTVKEIARQLNCSPSTVTNDLKDRP